jgi:hypothetical protein
VACWLTRPAGQVSFPFGDGSETMRVAFTADEGGFDADEYALVCGVAGEGHYLTLQRDAEGSGEDWGVHIEHDDQSNGNYGCVAACRLGPESLSVDLSRQLGRLAGVTGFDVALRLGPDQFSAMRAGLRRVFRGIPGVLADAEPDAVADGED